MTVGVMAGPIRVLAKVGVRATKEAVGSGVCEGVAEGLSPIRVGVKVYVGGAGKVKVGDGIAVSGRTGGGGTS